MAFISRPETSYWIESGMSPGSASMFTSRSSWLKMPPSATPGASSAPRNSIGTVALIAWSMRTRRRSTWIASPRTGWRWTSLISTFVDAPSIATSITWAACASVLRRTRASTAKGCGSSPPP